jgi:hypothetical protein
MKTDSTFLHFFPICFGILLAFIIIFFITIPIYDEYISSVTKEIENADCDELPLLYQDYDSGTFKEKIKSKYIFDCVAEKEQLESMR